MAEGGDSPGVDRAGSEGTGGDSGGKDATGSAGDSSGAVEGGRGDGGAGGGDGGPGGGGGGDGDGLAQACGEDALMEPCADQHDSGIRSLTCLEPHMSGGVRCAWCKAIVLPQVKC